LESLKFLHYHQDDCSWSLDVKFWACCNSPHVWDVDENSMIPWHKAFYVMLNGRHVLEEKWLGHLDCRLCM